MVEITEINVQRWLTHGGELSLSHVEPLLKFVNENPFYGPAQALLAKAFYNTNDERFDGQLRKASLCNNDRLWLYNFIHQGKINEDIETPQSQETVLTEPVAAPALETLQENQLVDSKEEIVINAVVEEVKEDKLKIEEPVKISITQGDGEILKGVEEEQMEASKPKLTVEDEKEEQELEETKPEIIKAEEFQHLNKTVSGETKEVKIKKQQEVKNYSFLDWLDKGDFSDNDKEQESVGKVEVAEKELLDNTLEANEVDKNTVVKTAELLEKFIANKPKPGEKKLEVFSPEEKALASESFDIIPISETLADVYIDQNEKELAKEIYEKLKLKFPEKSSYFADLIQKLNIN